MNTWIAGKDLMKPRYHLKNFFDDKLNLKRITDEEYKHAQKAWDTLNIKDLGATYMTFSISTRISMASMPKKDRGRIRVIN